MRSLFNPAPFSRFDLGKHVLGVQADCPPGQVALIQNGKVVCVQGYDPSLMARGELTPIKPNPRPNFNSGIAYGAMGQAAPAAGPVVAPAAVSGFPTVPVLVGGAVLVGILLLVDALT